jgi:hypothetical protein
MNETFCEMDTEGSIGIRAGMGAQDSIPQSLILKVMAEKDEKGTPSSVPLRFYKG